MQPPRLVQCPGEASTDALNPNFQADQQARALRAATRIHRLLPDNTLRYKGKILVAPIHRASQVGKHPLPPEVLLGDADVSLVVPGGYNDPELLGLDEGAGLARPVGEIGLDRNETFHGVSVDRHKASRVGQIDGIARFFGVMNKVGDHASSLVDVCAARFI